MEAQDRRRRRPVIAMPESYKGMTIPTKEGQWFNILTELHGRCAHNFSGTSNFFYVEVLTRFWPNVHLTNSFAGQGYVVSRLNTIIWTSCGALSGATTQENVDHELRVLSWHLTGLGNHVADLFWNDQVPKGGCNERA
jgi:hypothetical protein